jgi:hypothetical protein
MMVLYKTNSEFLSDHAVDPDKRRYAVQEEGPRHYIDLDHYGDYPYTSLPENWDDAIAKYTADSLQANGIVPWWINVMHHRLVKAFKEKDGTRILKLSAEIGHYISDAHVPLHASSNHDGQHTGQKGIHGFWESRVPELLAEKEWNFFIGKTQYINSPQSFIWDRVKESALAADTVLAIERKLSYKFQRDKKYSFEDRNGIIVRQFSSAYTRAYNTELNGMVERRMRQSIFAVASFWYTAWVQAGQPDLKNLLNTSFTAADEEEFKQLNQAWKANTIKGRAED